MFRLRHLVDRVLRGEPSVGDGTLADALERLVLAGIALEGASDHGVSEALYLTDPDGNGLDLYWDKAEADWPRNGDGQLAMDTRPLDLEDLLREPV